MTTKINRYVIAALFGLASLSTGCAARDVDVSQRGPIRGEATVEGDRSSETDQTRNKKSSGSGTTSGSLSGSGSGSGSFSGSGTVREGS